MHTRIELLNGWTPAEAERELLVCCGSTAWTRRMIQQRPFVNFEELFATAERTWWQLERDDWLEAFSRHPKIGEQAAESESERARRWSEQEQAATRQAPGLLLDELAEGNCRYQEKFGYIFIVCASGVGAGEMLALLRKRLQNDPGTELVVAAEQQRRITRLRLEKLLMS